MSSSLRPIDVFPITTRVLDVLRVSDVTPGMRRVTLGGPGLAAHTADTGYPVQAFRSDGFDDEFKIILKHPDADVVVAPTQADGVLNWPMDNPLLVARTYTVRRWDPAAGEIDVLVATTVIEVGVDVPNASLMVIEHAERFGLAQLHQLRGRVGRGRDASVCVLLYQGPLSEMARERLRIIFEQTDGFEIARQDLHLRGPGEFVGSRQSGVPLLRYADLEADVGLIELARDMAERLLREAPDRAARHLARWLGSREELLKA
mgnify:CR=1 FL=1